MSQEKVDTVRATYEQWGNGTFQGTEDIYDEHVLLVMRPQFPDAGVYVGVDEVAKYTRGFLEPWTHIAIEAEELIDAGDTVIAAVRQHGAGTESGAATEFRYFQVWTFRGPKVVRLENFRERAEALEAAGLA
jgi:ketosteroid isomerase-like protein